MRSESSKQVFNVREKSTIHHFDKGLIHAREALAAQLLRLTCLRAVSYPPNLLTHSAG